MTARKDRLAHLMAEATRRGDILADVNNLTDAYRLKVLREEIRRLEKQMAERESAVPLCTGGDPDHDDAS